MPWLILCRETATTREAICIPSDDPEEDAGIAIHEQGWGFGVEVSREVDPVELRRIMENPSGALMAQPWAIRMFVAPESDMKIKPEWKLI